MASMITFAANNDLFRKRKRVYRACEFCKKRRKRCTHTFTDGEDSNASASNLDDSVDPHVPRPETPTSAHRDSLEAPETPAILDARPNHQSPSTSPSRFIGHLRPEAVLQEQERDPNPQDHECGYWIQTPKGNRRTSTYQAPLTPDEQALETYLSLVNVSLLPSKEHLDSLLQLYFTYIHPMLPIVDQERPGRRNDGALLSPMLLQAICIITSRHRLARPHLVLLDVNLLLEPREFAKRLYKSVNAALNAKLEKDTIVLIQVHALLSLYVEGPDGAEQASLHLSQAVHAAHTLGMQFGRWRADDRAEYFQGLFWCIWGLDRLNSTTAGRPVMVHDRDSRLESPLSDPEVKHTAFGIWLQLARGLDHVITYYRPNTDPSCTGWEEEFPGFEDMLGDDVDTINPSILTTLELFYHAAAMCSHRSRPITEPVPSTPSYVRQSLSTIQVIQILSKEDPEDLSPLPLVPWALSLATANTYRQFRQSKLSSHRNRARNDLQSCCDLLQKMRNMWWSAGAMADLGHAALQQASKSRERRSKAQKPNGETSGAQNVARSTQNDVAPPESTKSLPGSTIRGSQHEPPSVTTPSLDFSSGFALAEPNLQMSSDIPTDGSFPTAFDAHISPDWLNFDNAFENFDAVLGNSGPDMSLELLRPFNFEDFGAFGFPD